MNEKIQNIYFTESYKRLAKTQCIYVFALCFSVYKKDKNDKDEYQPNNRNNNWMCH